MIIVLGAAGFIGTYLVAQLIEDGFDVLGADISSVGGRVYKKQNIPFIRLDITKDAAFDKLPQKGVDAVVHLACVQPANVRKEEYDPTHYIKVNVIGTLNALEFCRKTGIGKMIYGSSQRNTQGLWKEWKPLRENQERAIQYRGEYAMFSISESAAQDCVEHYTQEYGFQGVVFRLAPVYGYGPHTEIFKNGKPLKTGFQIFIENAIAGKPLEVWGDCENGRDIIYVKDVVSAIILGLKSKTATGAYNIASGRLLSLKEEAETIARVFSPGNKRSEITYRPEQPNSIEPFLYDISKVKRDLGWSPRYPFEEMLLDYKIEMENGRFNHLLEKRRRMMLKE